MAGCPRAGPRQVRARAWPASFIAGWVHGGASHSGGGEIGLAHYLSVSIGCDMSLSVSIGLGWCRPVSIGPSRPRWVSVGPDRSRSASIGCGSSGACPRPIGIDRRRSRPTETGRYRQNRSRLISTAETDQRPIETDRDRSRFLLLHALLRAERPPARPRIRSRLGNGRRLAQIAPAGWGGYSQAGVAPGLFLCLLSLSDFDPHTQM